MRNHIAGFAALLALGVAVVGCNETITEPAGFGVLKVSLTDAPGDFEAVNIHFSEISANIDSSWVSMQIDPVSVNLLDWTDGKTVELGSAEMPVGDYTQIRLAIDSADVVVEGQTSAMKVPSGSQSGYKIVGDFTIEEDVIYELVIDFDAAQSVVITGPPAGPATYILKPVIKIVSADSLETE